MLNKHWYPNQVTVSGEVVEVTDCGDDGPGGRKIVLSVFNKSKQRSSFDLCVKVTLYGRTAEWFLERCDNGEDPAMVIFGRLAVERDGTPFVIGESMHRLEVI